MNDPKCIHQTVLRDIASISSSLISKLGDRERERMATLTPREQYPAVSVFQKVYFCHLHEAGTPDPKDKLFIT